MDNRRPLLASVALIFALFLLAPAVLMAAEFSLTSDTLLRGFESKIAGEEDSVLPIYEYLQGSVGKEGAQPLTFHFYGWGRLDLAGSDYFEERFAGGDDSAGELLYGYLQYQQPDTSFLLRLGRQYIFEGVTHESIDGLRAEGALGDYFSASAFAGWPVGLDSTEGRSGDSIYGGRLANRLRGLYEVGLSYKSVDNDGDLEEEKLGIDISLLLPAGASLYGFSSRNLETEGWGEHFYEVRLNAGRLQVRPFFEHYRYEDYFGTGENTGTPFRFLAGLDQTLTVFGTDLLWEQSATWEWGVKGKYYDYDERDDSSNYLAALAIWHGENLSQAGGEFGRMDGDFDEGEYLLGRTYVYWDRPAAELLKFVTGDLVYVWYDEEIYGEDASLFVSVGGGTRLLGDHLELKVSADYSSDPYFDDDLRGWLTVRYAFSL